MQLMSTKYQTLFLAGLVSALAGCSQSPAEQCLDSFRGDLKDPSSGKVIAFLEDKLSYTATNSYGARTQGKALCTKGTDGKWTRDISKESLMISKVSLDKLNIANACLKDSQRKSENCASHSNAIRRANELARTVTVEELNEESARELGFSQ